jgi:transcription-repair coupling factor (superfamily II helicase)
MNSFNNFHYQNPARLCRFLERSMAQSGLKNHQIINVVGTHSVLPISLAFASNNSSSFNGLNSLIIVSSFDEAQRIKASLSFFSSDFYVHILDGFDVSPYLGLYPSPHVVKDRCRFFYWAQQTEKGSQKNNVGLKTRTLFIATISGLMQMAPPPKDFAARSWSFKQNDELPDNLPQFLNELGYQAAPLVEDRGQYSVRGGIVDIFSVADDRPTRLELFGDQIERIRQFSVSSQVSEDEVKEFHLAPAHEVNLSDDTIEDLLQRLNSHFADREPSRNKSQPSNQSEKEDTLRAISQKNYFQGVEYALPFAFEKLENVLLYFENSLNIFLINPAECQRVADEKFSEIQSDFKNQTSSLFRPAPDLLYLSSDFILDSKKWPPQLKNSTVIQFSNLAFHIDEENSGEDQLIRYSSLPLTEFSQISLSLPVGSSDWIASIQKKLTTWLKDSYCIVICVKSQTQIDRLKGFFAQMEIQLQPAKNFSEIRQQASGLFQPGLFILTELSRNEAQETILLSEEKLIFLRDSDFFGKKTRAKTESSFEEFNKVAKRLSFADLKPNDLVVHIKHGIGIYEGLKIMTIGGVESEFIQVAYKDRDKLYLPVYRVGQLQKYSGASNTTALDKLGGTTWEKTKIKVKGHLRDIASELLALYAKRSEVKRPHLTYDEVATNIFERNFPFEETIDQLRAISEIQKDFAKDQPMDRLICGDVGFGKTEVAMRAAFEVVANGKQVVVLAPTTVLSFQHFETFKRRFQNSPLGREVNIRALNRFVEPAETKKTLKELQLGSVDILIGTHRVISKDVQFKDLGLLIIDEEQKFGVLHKEKIKKMKTAVDTLTLSATPIPRTLNMSFTGVRDLSIINTAPVDRLPTRTFVSNPDSELIRKAIMAEIARGGQVYFIHNRVQSIYGVADEIRKIVPEARIRIGHGQQDEHELEATMLAFFNHEIDVLICTTIVESGMDVPRANTMFIDQAHMFGLSQLYQLRGRVGRSKARAYCYLLLPKDKKIEKDAQERLKIIQENSALGSGIKIAQYDLELRGAGNILGDDQSGHVNSVGYELYMDLLNEALAEAKGEATPDFELDPEINLRIPALIPDNYISDLRIRLSYYKALAEIRSQEDLDQIELELRDQFGEPPEPVVNLMGLMLIRRQCKDLGVRDVSAGPKSISLIFTPQTRMKPEQAIQLAMRENKKYSLTPDQRLNVRMNNVTWSKVFEEINYLLDYVGKNSRTH